MKVMYVPYGWQFKDENVYIENFYKGNFTM